MSWPFDDGSDLPLRDGLDIGGAQERTMAAMVGGYSGIRTVEELNPDGSITTLRTRGGRPIFETTAVVRRSSQAQKERGFVAKIPTRAVLFDPYTLDILDANYQPAVNAYSVQDFATSWNVPAADDTDWYDVVLFDGTTIKVNAKAMPTLGITANHGYPAIPYVINRETAEDQYGNAERNATEKRVFAVGRYSVTSWGGGGVTAVLSPASARADNKAMTIGQRISAIDRAMLSQFYFTGDDWNSLAGAWELSYAEVTMLLASPSLTYSSGSSTVDQPLCVPVATANTSPSSSVAVTLPATEICAVGVAELSSSSYVALAYTQYQNMSLPCRETLSTTVSGTKTTTGTAQNWSKSISNANSIAGRGVDYSASNVLSKTVQSETYSYPAFSMVTFPSLGGGTAASYDGIYYSSGGGTYVWTATSANTIPRDANGQADIDQSGMALGVSATYNTQTQSVTASAKLGAIDLVSVSLSRSKETGNQVTPEPNPNRFSAELGNPYRWTDPGSGFYESSSVFQLSMYAADPTHPDVVGKRPPIILAKAESFVGGKFYANTAHVGDQLYQGSVSSRPEVDNRLLSWNTTDYILYDETNGVYVSLIAAFSGSQSYGSNGTGTLTVSWKVQTRLHTTAHQIHEEEIAYTEMLPESVLVFGVDYIPSPKIRAIFAPLYQEQGSFKGAHYVTDDEDGNGASAFHGFDFVLKLLPYSSIADVNAANDDNAYVNFVPVNLLEMLYAYVYSSKYGVDLYDRYPVDRTATYTSITNSLFSTAYRVSVRDGVQVNWSDSFGSDFASIPTVSLHRA